MTDGAWMNVLGHLRLAHPWGLAALTMLPVLLWSRRSKDLQPRALVHPSLTALRHSFPVHRMASLRLLRILAAIVWTLWCLALSDPQWVGGEISVSREGRDVMLLVDLSGSMVIRDFSLSAEPMGRLQTIKHVFNNFAHRDIALESDNTVNRLQAIQHVLAPFIMERASDRLGLEVFGDAAYIQTPLTYDHALVRKLLLQERIGRVGEKTAIGTAIALAIKHLEQAARTRKMGGGQVIVLLTDGRNNAGMISPLHAAKLARTLGIRIYTVGVGSRLRMAGGNHAASLDEKTLKAIAKLTSGAYFRATDTSALADVASRINQMEKVEDQHTDYTSLLALYPEMLLTGLAIGCLMIFLARGRTAIP